MTVAALNEEVVSALKRAMRAKGIEGNAAAFTRLLRNEVGDGPDPSTVGRWLKGDQTVPAWALIAASRASGMAPTDLLLPGGDVDDLRRMVDDLRREVTELRSSIGAPVGSEGQRASTSEVEWVLAAVHRQLSEAAHELNLPWEEANDERPLPSAGGAVERLGHQLGLLQARMIDVRAALGLPWDAPPPGTSLVEATNLLQQQMQQVLSALVARRARDTEESRRTQAAE